MSRYLWLLCFCWHLAHAVQPKNLILMIGDGMGPAQVAAYHKFRKALLKTDDPFDRLEWLGKVRTDPSKAYEVTDSAAAATAYACGFKTYNGAICMQENHLPGKPLFVRAAERGLASGLVVTSQINHATPAAFAAVVESRKAYQAIVQQYVQNIRAYPGFLDVMLGGGSAYFDKQPSLKSDLRKEGYLVLSASSGLRRYEGGKPVLGIFAKEGLRPFVERKDDPDAVTLPLMVSKALERLGRQHEGFVLLVEGSQIDWASHDNDVLDTLWEMHEFAQAIEQAMAFADKRGDTLLLVTADHETGGMSLGRDETYRWNPLPIRGAQLSLREMLRQHAAGTNWKTLFRQQGVADLPAFQSLMESGQVTLKSLAHAYDMETLTGWSTQGHTAMDVDLLGFGPGAEDFRRTWQNDALGRALIQWVEGRGSPESKPSSRLHVHRNR